MKTKILVSISLIILSSGIIGYFVGNRRVRFLRGLSNFHRCPYDETVTFIGSANEELATVILVVDDQVNLSNNVQRNNSQWFLKHRFSQDGNRRIKIEELASTGRLLDRYIYEIELLSNISLPPCTIKVSSRLTAKEFVDLVISPLSLFIGVLSVIFVVNQLEQTTYWNKIQVQYELVSRLPDNEMVKKGFRST